MKQESTIHSINYDKSDQALEVEDTLQIVLLDF